MKPEVQEKTRTTDRDDTVCTPQPYRLICISGPGTKTGRRILRRSATVVVQTGEHKTGRIIPVPELPVNNGKLVPVVPPAPENSIVGIPAGDKEIMPPGSAESGDTRPERPAEPQRMVSGLPEGARKSGPEIPAETGYIMPEVPAGNFNSSPEQPAPDTAGGGVP